MKNSNKIGWGWAAFAFVVIHFTLIALYAFPASFIPSGVKSVASGYVQPFFEQTWALFAPAPLIDDRLEIKYVFEDDSTGWINPAAPSAAIHSRFRFTHHGDLVLGQSNLLYWLATDLDAMGISKYEAFPVDSSSVFKNTGSYYKIRRYVYGNACYLYKKQPKEALVRCSFNNVKTGESGSMILPEFEWKE